MDVTIISIHSPLLRHIPADCMYSHMRVCVCENYICICIDIGIDTDIHIHIDIHIDICTYIQT